MSDKWVARLDWTLTQTANLYTAALALVSVGTVVAVVVYAVVTQTWWMLAILLLPALWLVIWRSR